MLRRQGSLPGAVDLRARGWTILSEGVHQFRMFSTIHHVAIICSDILWSRAFYVGTLGFTLINEEWRAARHSWKCDLVNGSVQLELFTFEEAPARPTRPEAIGLRHLAFAEVDLEAAIAHLVAAQVDVEPVRTDLATGRRFTFFNDPDGLPIELYEA